MSGKPVNTRAPRIGTRQEAVLILSDGSTFDVFLVDVSKVGFRLEAGETLNAAENIQVGERVDIRMPRHGDVPARIRWARGFEAGGEFIGPAPIV